MAEPAYRYTYDKYDEYNEYKNYELLDGQLVGLASPSMRHGDIASNIHFIFKAFLRGKRCRAFGEHDVFLSPKDRVIPDVMVVCNRDIIKHNGVHGAPDLVVEVLSPTTAHNDRGYKMKLYARHGVKEYWLVDPKSQTIEVYLLQEGVFPRVYTLEDAHAFKTSLFDDLVITLADVFAEVIDYD